MEARKELRGKYHNGVIVLDDPHALREGQHVSVVVPDLADELPPIEGESAYSRHLREWLVRRKPMSPETREAWRRSLAAVEALREEDVRLQQDAVEHDARTSGED